MKKRIFIIGYLFYTLLSCQEKSNFPLIDNASGLLGRWENNTNEGRFSEIWLKENDSVFIGQSYFVKRNDTLFSETMKLETSKNKAKLIVSVPNQKTVEFLMTSFEKQKFVFENPNHDFPKKITYTILSQDSLFAEISGNGKKQAFPFKRIP